MLDCVQNEVRYRSFTPLGNARLAARDRRPDDRENPRPDHSPNTQRRQRPGTEGLFQAMFRILGVQNQLVNGLAAQQLACQGVSSSPLRWIAHQFRLPNYTRLQRAPANKLRNPCVELKLPRIEHRGCPISVRRSMPDRYGRDAVGAMPVGAMPPLLPFGLTARCLLQLLFVLATRARARTLRSGLLACGALQLLSFLYILNFGSVCHALLFSCCLKCLRGMVGYRYIFSSCANFSISFFTPNLAKCTVSFASSPSPSRRITVPSPYFP